MNELENRLFCMHKHEDFVLKKESFFFFDEEIVYLFDRGNNSFEDIAIYLEIYIITIMVYVMDFLIEFSSIANTNNSSERGRRRIDICLEFSSSSSWSI